MILLETTEKTTPLVGAEGILGGPMLVADFEETRPMLVAKVEERQCD